MNYAATKKLDESILKAREVHASIIRDEQDGLELKALNLLVDLVNLRTAMDQQTVATSNSKSAEVARQETPSTLEDDIDQAKNKIPQWKNNQS